MLLAPLPAAAQLCGPREAILSQLSGKYDETPIAEGVTVSGAHVELVASPDGKTWAILLTIPGGPTCLIAAGENWELVPVLKGEPS